MERDYRERGPTECAGAVAFDGACGGTEPWGWGLQGSSIVAVLGQQLGDPLRLHR